MPILILAYRDAKKFTVSMDQDAAIRSRLLGLQPRPGRGGAGQGRGACWRGRSTPSRGRPASFLPSLRASLLPPSDGRYAAAVGGGMFSILESGAELCQGNELVFQAHSQPRVLCMCVCPLTLKFKACIPDRAGALLVLQRGPPHVIWTSWAWAPRFTIA